MIFSSQRDHTVIIFDAYGFVRDFAVIIANPFIDLVERADYKPSDFVKFR
jgi:hypothetical protein